MSSEGKERRGTAFFAEAEHPIRALRDVLVCVAFFLGHGVSFD